MNFIQPNWPAPKNIHAFVTQRCHGNLGMHIKDDLETALSNRKAIYTALNLPNEPIWLKQIHSHIVVPATKNFLNAEADASYADQTNQVCAILTADCLPILLCDFLGKKVAAIHAGWRGLVAGIIENTVQKLNTFPENMLAWIGPGISGQVYEIDDSVRDQFIQKNQNFSSAFIVSKKNHWFADLPRIAKIILNQAGIQKVYGGEYCTFLDKEKFFSYRRDGKDTGRQASFIWMT